VDVGGGGDSGGDSGGRSGSFNGYINLGNILLNWYIYAKFTHLLAYKCVFWLSKRKYAAFHVTPINIVENECSMENECSKEHKLRNAFLSYLKSGVH
jgi:hypothetical protein